MRDDCVIARATLRDFGAPIGTTGYPESARHPERIGVLSETDVVRRDGDGEVLVRALVLALSPGVLGALARDQQVTVAGVPYRLLWRAPGHASALDRWAVAPA